MIKAILVFCCVFIFLPSHASNVAEGRVSAEVISINQPYSVKNFELDSKNVQLMSVYEKDGCVKFHFTSNINGSDTNVQKFGTCSNIVRTRVAGDSIIVSMPDNSKSGYSTYIYVNGSVKEATKK